MSIQQQPPTHTTRRSSIGEQKEENWWNEWAAVNQFRSRRRVLVTPRRSFLNSIFHLQLLFQFKIHDNPLYRLKQTAAVASHLLLRVTVRLPGTSFYSPRSRYEEFYSRALIQWMFARGKKGFPVFLNNWRFIERYRLFSSIVEYGARLRFV